MKTRFWLVACAMSLAVGAGAGSYNITTSAAQDTKLARARTILNAAGASYANVNAMVVDLCTQTLASTVQSVDIGDSNALETLARTATQAQRDNACTALGGTVVDGRCRP